MRTDSFDPENDHASCRLMAKIEAEFDTVDDSMREMIASRIMLAAGEGETDPEVIHKFAIETIQHYGSQLQKTG